MAEKARGEDPDARRARLAIAVIVALLLLVMLLVALFGPSAAYLAAALAAPLWLVAIILLSLESSDPEHARAVFDEDEDPRP
jgi:heme O synthase-like polyprenyltransferase